MCTLTLIFVFKLSDQNTCAYSAKRIYIRYGCFRNVLTGIISRNIFVCQIFPVLIHISFTYVLIYESKMKTNNTLDGDQFASIAEKLKTTNYGKCVWQSDNDVVYKFQQYAIVI